MSFNESLDAIVAENKNGLLAIHPSWERVRLREVCELLNGFPFQSTLFSSTGGFPLLRIRDVKRGSTETGYNGEYDSAYVVRKGDIVVGMDGDFNCAQWAGLPALLNQRVCRLTPDERYYSRRLLVYALQGYLNAINDHTPSITVKHLSSNTVLDIPLPLPPRQEQERLVEFLDDQLSRLDAAVELLERVRRNLKRYRASVLKAAVEGRLVPTEAELARQEGRTYEPASILLERILEERRRRWKENGGRGTYKEPAAPDTTGLPELPEGWCWATVEQLASHEERSIQSGPFGSNLRHSEFSPTGILVIGIDNVQDGYFSMGAVHRISRAKFQELQKYSARPGDVLVTVMATIGRCCVVPDDLEPAIITKHVYRITPEQRLVAPRFFLISLWGGPIVRQQMFGKAQGQTRLGLNGSIIRKLVIPVPPMREQERIVSEVDRLLSFRDEGVRVTETEQRRISRLRQSILKWAFEGRLANQDPNDEPAAVLLERIRAAEGRVRR